MPVCLAEYFAPNIFPEAAEGSGPWLHVAEVDAWGTAVYCHRLSNDDHIKARPALPPRLSLFMSGPARVVHVCCCARSAMRAAVCLSVHGSRWRGLPGIQCLWGVDGRVRRSPSPPCFALQALP